MESRLESGLWVKIILNPGLELLVDQINLWWNNNDTQVPVDQPEEQALQLKVNDFFHSDLRQKQNRNEEHLLIYRASFRWVTESGLILNQENLLSLCTRSRRKSSIFFDTQTVQREDDGAVQLWKIKNFLPYQFPQVQHWSDDRWKACLAARGGAKRRYQYCTDISGIIVYFRALQGHSGRNLMDPSLQDNVLIGLRIYLYIYHIGSAFNLRSIINNALVLGGQNSSKRQTVFFRTSRSWTFWLLCTTSREIREHVLGSTVETTASR